MRIALVVHDLHQRGGHARYTFELAQHLRASNDVTVFSTVHEANEATWHHVHVASWRRKALTATLTFPLGLRLHARELRGFDIVHNQGFCGGAPNVVTAHICVKTYLRSLVDPPRRMQTSLSISAVLEGRFYSGFTGTIIAVSKRIAHDLVESYGTRARVVVIPHGVDSQRFAPASAEARAALRAKFGFDARPVCLYVGDLAKARTHLVELAHRAPDVTVAVVSRDLSLAPRGPNIRTFSGSDEIQLYYQAADAFLFPSSYDAFGLVALEAMATGLPVFCSDQAGVQEQITHGENGFVSPLSTWVEDTVVALRNRERLRPIGLAARELALTQTWGAVAERVERVYAEARRERPGA